MRAKTAHVIPKNGAWAVKKEGHPNRSAGIYAKQREAIEAARDIVQRTSAGQVVIHHRGGSIQTRDIHGLPEVQQALLREKKLTPRGVEARISALRFLFVKTLKRHEMHEHLPFPKIPRNLPVVMSQEEVAKVIDNARNLLQRTRRKGPFKTHSLPRPPQWN